MAALDLGINSSLSLQRMSIAPLWFACSRTPTAGTSFFATVDEKLGLFAAFLSLSYTTVGVVQ